MELKEAVEALASHPKEEVSKALKEEAPSLWQHVHDIGFSNANDKAKANLKTVEDSLKTAETTIAEKDEKIAELEKGQPDLEEIRETHRKAIEKLEAKHTSEIEKAHKSLADTRRDNAYHRLLTRLSDLDDDYAEVRAQQAMSRVQWDKDGKVEVMQESGIPFVPSDKKDGIALLAEEIVTRTTETKPRMVKSDVDRGSGAKNGQPKTGGTLYEGIREKAKTLNVSDPARQQKIGKLTGVTPAE